MKPNKYNPKIPNKYDGHTPSDWKYPGYEMRVTLYVTPDRVPYQIPQHLLRYMNQYSYQFQGLFPMYTDDFDTPCQNTIEALQQLMNGAYVAEPMDDCQQIVVYCNQWLDPVVIKLSHDPEMPTALNRAKVERRKKMLRARISNETRGLLSKISAL